jgi:DNA-binding response OmpR family regulator
MQTLNRRRFKAVPVEAGAESPPQDLGVHAAGVDLAAEKVLRVGSLTLWPDRHCISVEGRMVHLTAGQCRLLARLAAQPFRSFAPLDLCDAPGQANPSALRKAVRSRIFVLRQRLGACGRQLETVRHEGYRLVE